ncbi:hypothetical protein JP75_07010 [Devosia riboflavina]|uniref:Uncharacterized protein n=1 Tax=Devosia riboflavina TaxID=46914 RepID=A0A087M4J7_9HYPH|nr:hypothetical protein JP75_07010 [Devosia riboflavina]
MKVDGSWRCRGLRLGIMGRRVEGLGHDLVLRRAQDEVYWGVGVCCSRWGLATVVCAEGRWIAGTGPAMTMVGKVGEGARDSK